MSSLSLNERHRWIQRIVTWDGVLPLMIWTAPSVLRLVLPNQREPIELIAVVVPIAAFFVRLRVGRRHISANYCGARMRAVQLMVLGLGLALLTLIDAVMILTHVMPPGAVIAGVGDMAVWAILYLTYVGLMAVAWYPGPISRRGPELPSRSLPSEAGAKHG